MKLEKAIELLQLDLDDPGSVPIEDLNQAQALSIEALTVFNDIPPMFRVKPFGLLPGETDRTQNIPSR